MKRSKVFKIKNQPLSEDTAKEREFRRAATKYYKDRKGENIILAFSLLIVFALSVFVERPNVRGACELATLVIGLLGIFR